MGNLIIGIILGAIFSPILIRLAKLGIEAVSKNVKHLEEKHGDEEQ